MREIEILVEVLEDKEAARAKLKRFKNHGVKHIVDTYYVHPAYQPAETLGEFSSGETER